MLILAILDTQRPPPATVKQRQTRGSGYSLPIPRSCAAPKGARKRPFDRSSAESDAGIGLFVADPGVRSHEPRHSLPIRLIPIPRTHHERSRVGGTGGELDQKQETPHTHSPAPGSTTRHAKEQRRSRCAMTFRHLKGRNMSLPPRRVSGDTPRDPRVRWMHVDATPMGRLRASSFEGYIPNCGNYPRRKGPGPRCLSSAASMRRQARGRGLLGALEGAGQQFPWGLAPRDVPRGQCDPFRENSDANYSSEGIR